METQTRFDLNAAILNWQDELVAQPGLTLEVRRELETHLRDTIRELQQRGLNNEESFWLARRRTGKPQQLGEEFAKEDSTRAWRDRILWIAVGLLFFNYWGAFVSYRFGMSNPAAVYGRLQDFFSGWTGYYLPHWLGQVRGFDILQILFGLLHVAPVFLLPVFLANRQLKIGHTAVNYIVAGRARFIWTALGGYLIANYFNFWTYGPRILSLQLPWVLSLIALAAWLIPEKKSAVAKPA